MTVDIQTCFWYSNHVMCEYMGKELTGVKELSLCLAISLLLLVGIPGMAGAVDDWNKGENRILNSGFEDDKVGEPPNEWSLEKDG